MSVKIKVNIVIVVVLIASFVGFAYYDYTVSKNYVLNEVIKKDLPSLSEHIKDDVELKMAPNISLVSAMGNNYFLQKWLKDGEKDLTLIKDFFQTIHNNYNLIVASVSSNQSFLQYTKDGVFTKLNETDPFNTWFFSFIKKKKTLELNITVDELREFKTVAFINHVLKTKEGEVLGLTTVGLDIDEISKYILKYVNPNRDVYIINKKGFIIVHKNKDLIYVLDNEQKNKNRNIKYISGIDTFAGNILSSKGTLTREYINKNNKKRILISNYIPSIDSYLIIDENEEALFSQISHIFENKIMVSLVGMICIILLIIFILNAMLFRETK